MVQDVQLHGSRSLVADAMSSSPSIRPRNSEILEQPCQESSVEQPVESKRAKASQPSVAGSPTSSAEQPAKPWGIWEAERQVDVPRHMLTHTRALPLPTTIVCDIDGSTCHGVYLGHGQSKIVYRLPDDRVLKLCDKRNQEADLFATWHSIGAYPIIYASNQCTVHITKIIRRTHTVTHPTWYAWVSDYTIPLDSILKTFPSAADVVIVGAVRAMIRHTPLLTY